MPGKILIEVTERDEAIADGGTPAPEIGPDWVRFEPWDSRAKTGARERLRRWCRHAFADATAIS